MMDSIYRENIIEHYQHPDFKGRLDDPTISGRDANPLCGDDLTIELKISSSGLIQQCSFHGKGCSISQASADILLGEVTGKSVEEVMKMTKEEMLELLGIPLGPVRLKCGLLAFKVIKVALIKHSGGSLESFGEARNY